jgi:hypothetical protein
MRTILAVCLLAAALGRAQTVSGPLVTSDRWPRSTDLVTWTRDVMRLEGIEKGPETAQGKALFEWLRLFCRMAVGGMIQAYEGEYNKERYVVDTQKNLFVYGWGYCDTFSRIAEAAWREYKGDARAAERVIAQHDNGGYHTMYRLRLDGNYGAFDARYGYYLIDRDAPGARVLDWPEVGIDENILRNKSFRYRCRPWFEIGGIEYERALAVQPKWFDTQEAWQKAGAAKENVFGDSHHKMGTRFHDMDFRLPKGATIERFWDNSERKFYVPAGQHTKRELPFLPSGRFYRVTDKSHQGNWLKDDPNYKKAEPYLFTVPAGEGYPADLENGRTIGQAWGRILYTPDLKDAAGVKSALAPGSTLVHSASAPYLRPAQPAEGGSAVLDFYCPYVLVDGALDAALTGAAKLEIRTLRAKNSHEGEADVWSEWQSLGGGNLKTGLGRPRFNGRDVSIHGIYRFQLRVTVDAAPGRTQPAGLSALKLALDFENGIMSIPRIFAGANTIRFQVRDAKLLQAPVRVTYKYRTASGPKSHVKTLAPADFIDNQATYKLEAPGLIRCDSVSITY